MGISPGDDGEEIYPNPFHNTLFFSGNRCFMVHLLESGLGRPNNDSTGQLPICLSRLIPRVSETRFADRPCRQEQAIVRSRIARLPATEGAASRSQRSDDPGEMPLFQQLKSRVLGVSRAVSWGGLLFHPVFHEPRDVRQLVFGGERRGGTHDGNYNLGTELGK